MSKSLVLLDLDGCVFDSASKVSFSYAKSLSSIGIEISEVEFQDRFFGKSFDLICEELQLQMQDRVQLRKTKDEIFADFASTLPIKLETISLVQRLVDSQTSLVAATHASQKTVEQYLLRLRNVLYFSDCLTPQNFRFHKTSTDYYYKASALYSVSIPKVTLIDDDETNIGAAKLAGCKTILITAH